MPQSPTPTPSAQRRVRLFVETALSEGCALTLSPKQAHYLIHVMRVQAGESVTVFDGVNGEWRAIATQQAKSRWTLSVTNQVRPQEPELGPSLLFAPIKRAPLEFLIEKSTELGAGSFRPVVTERTVAARINLDRLRLITIEAAEQSGRLTVPAFSEPMPLATLAQCWTGGAPLWVLDASGRGTPIAEAAISLTLDPRQHPGIVVGPEGGFTPSELDAFEKLSIVTLVTLGPRTLRCETAALAALSCWQAVAGDWRRVGPTPTFC